VIREQRRDRGAAMVLFGMTLTVLMAMSAFAVDVGMLFAERRENQSAADTGALAGALDLPSGVATASEAAAAIVRENLDTSYSDLEWAAAWADCTDDGALTFTGEVLGSPTPCISTDGLGVFRVVVPDQAVPTAFASAVGFDSFTSSATAETELVIRGVGGVLPFALLGSAPSGDIVCLRSSTNGQAIAPCTGTASGNFGALEVPVWGNAALGTETLPCHQTSKSDELLVNISVGVDHFLRIWDGTTVLDTCAEPFGPNTLSTFQGISGGLFEGMITGDVVEGVAFPGRLTRGSTSKISLVHNSGTYGVDNVPLWEYIGAGKAGSVPADCTRESFATTLSNAGFAAAETQLAQCLLDYEAGAGAYETLFDHDADDDGDPDIVNSPRFAIVPQFIETGFPNGNSGSMRIAGYRAVFVQGLYFGCSGGGCSTIHTPGSATGSLNLPGGSSPLAQITSFLLPGGAAASDLLENGIDGELGAYQLRLKS